MQQGWHFNLRPDGNGTYPRTSIFSTVQSYPEYSHIKAEMNTCYADDHKWSECEVNSLNLFTVWIVRVPRVSKWYDLRLNGLDRTAVCLAGAAAAAPCDDVTLWWATPPCVPRLTCLVPTCLVLTCLVLTCPRLLLVLLITSMRHAPVSAITRHATNTQTSPADTGSHV